MATGEPLAGVILCGGSSSRMGADKEHIVVSGLAMVEWVTRSLASVGADPIVLVGGTSLRGEARRRVADRVRGSGPLGGIVAALDELNSSLLVVPCDIPAVSSLHLLPIISASRAVPNVDAVLAHSAHGVEPLLGIYRPSARVSLAATYNAGTRSPMRALAALRWVSVSLPGFSAPSNVNTPEQLADVTRHLADSQA